MTHNSVNNLPILLRNHIKFSKQLIKIIYMAQQGTYRAIFPILPIFSIVFLYLYELSGILIAFQYFGAFRSLYVSLQLENRPHSEHQSNNRLSVNNAGPFIISVGKT